MDTVNGAAQPGNPIAVVFRPPKKRTVTFCRLAARSSQTVMIWKIVISALVGGGVGFAYYRFVGCPTGTCPLTSNPYVSTIYGAVLGVLIGTQFR